MWKAVLLSITVPAAAIVIGAFSQLGLITVWPEINRKFIANVSLDTYFGIVAILLFSIWAGAIVRRNTPNPLVLVLALGAPLAWLLLGVATQHTMFHAGLLGGLLILSVVAPAIGVVIGWLLARPGPPPSLTV